MKKEWLYILGVKSEKEIDNISNKKWVDISWGEKISENFIEKFQIRSNRKN